MVRKIIFTTLLMLWVIVIEAREIAGIALPEQIVRKMDNAELVLNGAGIRKKFFFDVYLASLYLQARSSDVAEVINVDRPARIEMRILYSEIKKEKFVKGWDDGFSANLSPDGLQAVAERLARFNEMFQTLHEGDLVIMDYLPGSGTALTIKDEEKGVIPGADFYQALLMVWLGDSPINATLKQELLGAK
jgi:hypothetical protein